ncbi:sensor histidine kinase [Reinekea blandensis]|uniref:Two-component system sensor protein n=1 Tax=Reinekea blandensis MED297 TaxID=314283 RepID=A4BDW2_9GAMM|nr:sensor histidine kinase [Reinekea blandensis]EAR09721.1 two-component system sensor protein [Reinekea blandensis MED297]
MYQNSIAQNLEGMTGYLAWAVVCYLTLSSQPTDTLNGQLRLFAVVLCLLLFIIGFYLTTRDQEYTRMDKRIRQWSIIAQLVSVILIRLITNSGVIAILGVALAAQLPIRFSRLVAYFGVMALVALDWYFNAFYWSVEDALVWTSLAGAFNLFAFRMSQRVLQEQEARDEISMLNRELIATQALLQESTKQSERLRISRDLHDGLGHHLTALILKLQYLTYTTSGENQTLVKEAHDMAKQLLTDVRETVSEMRENSNIGLEDALEALISQIPRLKIELDIDPALQLPDAKTADTLFRCVQEGITNTLKHGNASEMSIRLTQVDSNVELQIHDNGYCQFGFSEGNGLTGMRERIEKLRGQLTVSTKRGFGLVIRIPTMEAL